MCSITYFICYITDFRMTLHMIRAPVYWYLYILFLTIENEMNTVEIEKDIGDLRKEPV